MNKINTAITVAVVLVLQFTKATGKEVRISCSYYVIGHDSVEGAEDVMLVETQGQFRGLVEIFNHTEKQWTRVCNSSSALQLELLCGELGFSSTSAGEGKN